MASITSLTTGNSGSASSAATASISPGPNRLVLLSVISAKGSGGDVTTPTASGCGITWVQIATRTANAGNWRATMFRELVSAPTSGQVTISFGGQTQHQGIGWNISEAMPVKTTGANGADAVVQSATGLASGTNTGLTITLSAFANPSNLIYAFVASQGVSITVGSGFTQLGLSSITATGFQVQYKLSADTAVDWTWGSVGTEGPGIAIEIAISGDGILTGEI